MANEGTLLLPILLSRKLLIHESSSASGLHKGLHLAPFSCIHRDTLVVLTGDKWVRCCGDFRGVRIEI